MVTHYLDGREASLEEIEAALSDGLTHSFVIISR